MPYYAVARGVVPGIYSNWPECEKHVKGFSGAKFKKFNHLEEAQQYIALNSTAPIATTRMDNVKPNTSINQSSLYDSWKTDKKDDEVFLSALNALEEFPDYSQQNNKTKEWKDWKSAAPNSRISTPQSHPINIDGVPFTKDDDNFINVYISSNVENLGNWNCIAGYGVYFGKNNPLNHSEPASGRLTRNVGVILAAIKAIETAKVMNIEKLCIHTDSEFLLKAITTWIHKWKINDWRNYDGRPVQNRKELKNLDALLNDDKINVKWFNSKYCGFENKSLDKAKILAEIGTEEYLEQHPAKEDLDYLDMHFDFF